MRKDTKQIDFESKEVRTQIELPDVEVPNGNGYSEFERRNAAFHYVVHGTMAKVSRTLNIPYYTLKDWKKTEWWQSLTNGYRDQFQDELDAGFTDVIHEATYGVLRSIKEGDEVYDKKTGQMLTKRPSGREMALMMAIYFDKRQLLRNNPTSISSKSATEELKDAAKRFEEIASKRAESGLDEVVGKKS